MTKIGYVRASTIGQNLDLQIIEQTVDPSINQEQIKYYLLTDKRSSQIVKKLEISRESIYKVKKLLDCNLPSEV